MKYPIIVFQDNATSYRILVPDFNSLTVSAETFELAVNAAENAVSERLITLINAGKSCPKASHRDVYIKQYIDAVLVNTIDIDLNALT